jgi:DNA-binding CsgD family transcriptional regulator
VTITTPTRRELDCLRLYGIHGSARIVALELGISSATVRAHLAALRARLGVETTVQAIYRLRDRLG